MANAARVHAVERGKDPRGLPAVRLRRRRAGPRLRRRAHPARRRALIVPFGAGVTSAHRLPDRAAGLRLRAHAAAAQLDGARLGAASTALFDEMEAEGAAIAAPRRRAPSRTITVARAADMRYVGQGHEIDVPIPGRRARPGQPAAIPARVRGRVPPPLRAHWPPDVPLEAVSWRVVARGPRPELRLPARRRSGRAARRRERQRAGLLPRVRRATSRRRSTTATRSAPGAALRRAGDRRGARVDHRRRAGRARHGRRVPDAASLSRRP